MKVRQITGSALLAAIGVLLPQVFHMMGGTATGGMFLPMHIPVLLAGMLYGPMCGACVGVLSPTLSFLIFGMPPAAKYPFMLIELILYGLASGVIERALRRFETVNLIFTTFLAQTVGRAAYAGCLWLGGRFLVGVDFPAVATVTAALATGLPGIVIQLVLVPAMYSALRKIR